MTRLTVVGFASGSPQSHVAMTRLASEHRLAAIVTPQPRRGLRGLIVRARRGSADPLADLGVPIIHDLDVSRFRPDLIVVASFPRILPSATLAAARLGGLNIHMSVLPRHRGSDPIFWTYWEDDRNAGVTIHWLNERIDAGEIAAQEQLPLSRGLASRELYRLLSWRGVELLSQTLDRIAHGDLPHSPQDQAHATYKSAADIARARIPLRQWPAERVWHVLSGLGDQFHHLLDTETGAGLPHGRATRYNVAKDTEPGRIVARGTGYELHCHDGIVWVEPPQ